MLRTVKRPDWLRCDLLLAEHGLTADTAANGCFFARRTEALRVPPGKTGGGPGVVAAGRGWMIGAKDFAN